jgi:molecular chaperone DnaK (HSP70)
MGKVIGVDLGTTNSCVAILEGGNAQVVANSEGARTTPSMVGFTDSGEKLVGQVAKRQGVTNPERTIYAVKRLIGRKRESEEVERFAAISPFGIEAADNGDAWVRVEERLCSPQEISAVVLAKMRETAADFLGEAVTDAVITVPAYFNDAPGHEGGRADRRPERAPHHQRAHGGGALLRGECGHAPEGRRVRSRRRHVRYLDPRALRRCLRGQEHAR